MGTPGVPLNLPPGAIAASIKKNKGVGSKICKELDIHHSTFIEHVRADPVLVKLLDDARHDRLEERLDDAENTLDECKNQRQELSVALKSAMYLLNNRGKSRGYAPIVHGAPVSEPRLDAIDGNSTDLVDESKQS